MTQPEMVFVRTGSHRARSKLYVLCPGVQEYFSWTRDGSWALIPTAKLAEALKITGVNTVRKTDDLEKCIKWSWARPARAAERADRP